MHLDTEDFNLKCLMFTIFYSIYIYIYMYIYIYIKYHKNINQHNCFDIDNMKSFLSSKSAFARMLFEGWSNGCWKLINYIWKYIKIVVYFFQKQNFWTVE